MSAAKASGVHCPTSDDPVDDIIDVRVATRFGWRIATSWATMPPNDAPMT